MKKFTKKIKFGPTWGIEQQFLVDAIYYVFEEDALEGTPSVDQDAYTPEELQEKYGAVTYRKGASIIRMFNYTMGNDKFTAGIRRYLKEK